MMGLPVLNSLSLKLDKVGICANTSPYSVHRVVGILVKQNGCYHSVYFEEASIAVEFRCKCFRCFRTLLFARYRQIEKHTPIFQIAIRQNSKENC